MTTFKKNNSLLIGSVKEEFSYDPNKLVLVYDTNLEPSSTTITLALMSGPLNVTVDWGDGTFDVYTTIGLKTHTYASHGEYVVQISGFLQRFGQRATGPTSDNKPKLKRCLSFGNIGIIDLQFGFYACPNLIEAPKSLPTSTSVTNLSNCFYGCSSFNDSIENWNTSAVTNMSSLFYSASIFNQNINNWNVSNVTDMGSIFRLASNYNQSMNSWDTNKVTNMGAAFLGAINFNGNISAWNTSNVTNMSLMFYYNYNFNQNISSWNTSKVTTMSQMFSNCINFNQNIGSWDVSKVTVMDFMLDNADSFSSNLGNWNLSSLNSSGSMFGFMRFATGLNVSDYDNTLIGWNNNKASFRNDINISFGGSKYSSAAASARAALIAYGWTIIDGGLAP
jgi:surface protein